MEPTGNSDMVIDVIATDIDAPSVDTSTNTEPQVNNPTLGASFTDGVKEAWTGNTQPVTEQIAANQATAMGNVQENLQGYQNTANQGYEQRIQKNMDNIQSIDTQHAEADSKIRSFTDKVIDVAFAAETRLKAINDRRAERKTAKENKRIAIKEDIRVRTEKFRAFDERVTTKVTGALTNLPQRAANTAGKVTAEVGKAVMVPVALSVEGAIWTGKKAKELYGKAVDFGNQQIEKVGEAIDRGKERARVAQRKFVEKVNQTKDAFVERADIIGNGYKEGILTHNLITASIVSAKRKGIEIIKAAMPEEVTEYTQRQGNETPSLTGSFQRFMTDLKAGAGNDARPILTSIIRKQHQDITRLENLITIARYQTNPKKYFPKSVKE